MKNIKKLLALAITLAMMMIPVAAFADDDVDSPGITIEKGNYLFVPFSTSKVYNGKKANAAVAVYDNSGYLTKITGNDQSTLITNSAAVGDYTLSCAYEGKDFSFTYTIKGADQKVTVSPASKTYKHSKVKKKAKSFTVNVSSDSNGKVTYKSSSSKIKVKKVNNKKAKITVKKKTKKGTYTVTVKVAAKGNYAAKTETITIVVK